MNGLVLFRSFYGNSKQVAEYIAQQISILGHHMVVHDLREKLPDLHDIDFVIIGAPTRMAGVTGKATNVLKQLHKNKFTKPVAIFDLYGPLPNNPEELEKDKKWFYPGAAGKMQKEAQKQGLNLYPETLRCKVKDMKGPLEEGELEKAVAFARDFMSWVTPI